MPETPDINDVLIGSKIPREQKQAVWDAFYQAGTWDELRDRMDKSGAPLEVKKQLWGMWVPIANARNSPPPKKVEPPTQQSDIRPQVGWKPPQEDKISALEKPSTAKRIASFLTGGLIGGDAGNIAIGDVWSGDTLVDRLTERTRDKTAAAVQKPRESAGDLPVVRLEKLSQERGPQRAVLQVAGGLTSPKSIALLIGAGKLGKMGEAGAAVSRLMSAGFSADQIINAAKRTPGLVEQIKQGDWAGAGETMTGMGIEVGMALLGAKHAATSPKAAPAAEPPAPLGVHGPTTPATPSSAPIPIEEIVAATELPKPPTPLVEPPKPAPAVEPPPLPKPAGGVTPDRLRTVMRGQHDRVRVEFPDPSSAYAFDAVGKTSLKRAGGKNPKGVDNSWMADLPNKAKSFDATPEEVSVHANDYHAYVKGMAKSQPPYSDGELRVKPMSFGEFIASRRQSEPPAPVSANVETPKSTENATPKNGVEPPSRGTSAPGAVEPVQPPKPPATAAEPAARPVQVIQPWEMTRDEIEQAHSDAKAADKNLLVDLFGEDGAKRYKSAERTANSSTTDPHRSLAASKLMQDMEERLSAQQRNRLYGISEEDVPSLDELNDYRSAMNGLDYSSPEALGDSLKYAMVKVGDNPNPAKMTHEQRVAYATLREAYRVAMEEGWDPAVVSDFALEGAAGRFRDPADAAYMLSHFLKANKPKPKTASREAAGYIEPPKPRD